MSLQTFATDTMLTGGRGAPNAISPGSDGFQWNLIAGDQTPSFASNQLVFTYNASTNLGVWTYSSQSQADQEALVNMTQSGANTDIVGIILRCSDPTHYYYFDIGNNPGYVEIGKNIGGSFSTLASAPFSSSYGTKYSMRAQVVGDTLKCKAWDSSTNEPTNWNVQWTDNTLYAGGFGVCFAPGGSHNCKFDNFIATNGVFVSLHPVDPAYGAEQLGLVAASLNAVLVPPLDITPYSQWSLQIDTMASGGTITFEGSNDGVNFANIYARKGTDDSVVGTTSAAGLYYAPRICRYIQAIQTGWSSGVTKGTLELHK